MKPLRQQLPPNPLDNLRQELTSEDVLTNLLTHMPMHIYWKNSEGVYLGCNELQAKSLGLNSTQEVIGKTDFELPWDEHLAKRFWQNDSAVMLSQQAKIVEEQAVVNHRPAVVLSIKAPLFGANSEVQGVLGVSIDITKEKLTEAKLRLAKEAAEAASQAKLEFMQNIRHDIRTPLTGLIGCVDLMKASLEDSNKTQDTKIQECKEYTGHLQQTSQALLQLLNEVMESIKVATGEIPFKQGKFDLTALLTSVLALNQAQAASKNLLLTIAFDESIPRYVIGDHWRIHRILLELVTNALKFTDYGTIALSTQLVARHAQLLIIKISIQDTGIGIAPEQQACLFTPFKRLTPAYQGRFPGRGLGLALVKQLLDPLKGELYLTSEVGKGSVFTCVLPLQISLINEPESETSQIAIPNPPINKLVASSLKILIVEDDKIAAQVTKHLLENLGCQADCAYSGAEALVNIQNKKYALILMDVGLPDTDGIMLSKKIRKELSLNQETPIVVLTAHADEERQKSCHEIGIKKILLKPLSRVVAQEIIKDINCF